MAEGTFKERYLAGSGHGLPAFFRPSPCGGEGRRNRPGPEGRKGSVWMIQGQRR